MEQFIDVNNFKNSTLEAGKLYTIYYQLSDEELNNYSKLSQIIETLWDRFMYDNSLDTNIHLDRNEKLITVSVKLKDNAIVEENGKLTALAKWLGSNILNAVSPLLNIKPIAVTVQPLIVKIVEDEIKTVTEVPIVKTTVNTAGKLVNSVNQTFENTSKILPYLPYILVGSFVLLILSYSNTNNIKQLFKRSRK